MAVEIFQQRTHWEDPGVERPEGSRYWSAAEEPPAEHFNWWFWSTYKDIEDLAKYVQDHGGAKFFPADSLILLSEYSVEMEVLDSGIAVLLYPAETFNGAVLVTRTFKPSGSDHHVVLWWAPTAANSGESVVWQVKYAEVSENGTLNPTLSTMNQIVEAPTGDHIVRKTQFSIGNLTPGNLLVLWICRDGAHASDALACAVELAFVEVK